jgi:hypothetical protein
MDSYRYIHAYIYLNTNGNVYCDTDSYLLADLHFDTHPYSDDYIYANAYCYRDPHLHTNADVYTNPYVYAFGFSYTRAASLLFRDPERTVTFR